MRYYSTRGKAELTGAAEVIMKGLAPDGGLYVPSEDTASFKVGDLPSGSYQEIAKTIFRLYLTDYSDHEIDNAIDSAYSSANFDHPRITPLHRITGKLHIMELWHGPTYAFKDIALQILPRLLNMAMAKSDQISEIVILTATSGDTGKSALEGFRDVEGVRIIVYFPENGVSEVQKLQMITQEGGNVSVAAVKGNFDDTQAGVKAIFSDRKLSDQLAETGYSLSSANSINWGRLLPQIVYYFAAYQDLVEKGEIAPGEVINFVVPTGNFGNILAGYYARIIGLPVNRLICASNRNNVLSDFINSGIYNSRRPLHLTSSPSMDILISSNLERLLFELTGHDFEKVSCWMSELKDTGEYQVDRDTLEKLRQIFWSDYADEEEASQAIADTYNNFQYLIDTHTAVGMTVLGKYVRHEKDNARSVLLSTASPYKFAGSVARALFGEERFKDIPELELLEILSRETGSQIPANLANLERKPVRHKQVITRDAMRSHLLEVLKLKNLPE
jgi:threonine synthase